MKADIKQKWIKALKSGKYKQTVGRLKANKKAAYCCLGVLSDIYCKETNTPFSHLIDNAVLPTEVMDWAGLKSTDPFLKKKYHFGASKGTDGVCSLSGCNDKGKMSFKEIAKLIEDNKVIL